MGIDPVGPSTAPVAVPALPPGLKSEVMSPQELNQILIIEALNERLKSVEGDVRSAEERVKLQNDKILRLEAENIRLKMQRTDVELSKQVDGLRTEVGKKDKELVELRRRIDTLQSDQVSILRRATVAEEKIKIFQNTIETIQKGRDAAAEKAEQANQDRLDALRKMVDAEDRAKKAQTRVAELEKRNTKPIAKDHNALRAKK
jgi:chromosome segregation ATPase